MKHLPITALALCLPILAAPAQAEDIMSILARKADMPPRLAPKTIEYSYTLTVDIKSREGKDLSEGQAVVRVDPSKPAGSRKQIISISDPENEALQDFLKDSEDPDNTPEERAEEFWCGDSGENPDDEPALTSDLSNLTVISETETEAVLQPDMKNLAKLLMQSDGNPEDANKDERKMAKKLLERIEGNFTLAKPSAELKGFSVRMTRPMTIKIVAKLKEMDVTQTCELAPNGHYHISTMKMNVQGKALGIGFGQEIDMRITDLRPLP